jgi:hypothetical protein
MKSTKKLPLTVYVTWNKPGPNDDAYLLTGTTWQEHADLNGAKQVGVYKLAEVLTVDAPAIVVKPKRGKRV